MAKIKGTDLTILRNLIRDQGPAAESKLLSQLSEEAGKVYRTALPILWIPIEIQAQIYEAAAAELYPRSSNPVQDLFMVVSSKTYSTIYKVFLSIPSLEFIMSQAAKVWGNYYDKGKAFIENKSEKSVDFVVVDFPDLPKAMREATISHVAFLAKNSGLKAVQVTLDESNPNKWVWHVTWA